MSKREISGSRALVTGASSGIGRELALAFARGGGDVVVLARHEEKLRALADEIRATGRRAEVAVGDVCDPTTRSSALALAEQAFGGLDILVNNAGISAHGRFDESSPERLRQIMEVNFFAAAEFTRAAVPLLQQGRRPIVVNIGSILGHRGLPHNSEYCASKFALRGLSESIRPELARLGIDLLLVSPGSTDTEFFDHLIERQGDLPWAPQRGVPPAEVARQTLRALERNRREITPNPRGRLLVWANRLAPGLVDRWMRRYG